jgi:hypothetical protein
MRSQVVGLIVLTALILAAIFAIAPRTTIVADEISGEVYAIDIAGFTTKEAKEADEVTARRLAKH